MPRRQEGRERDPGPYRRRQAQKIGSQKSLRHQKAFRYFQGRGREIRQRDCLDQEERHQKNLQERQEPRCSSQK